MNKEGALANFVADLTENLHKDLSALGELGSTWDDRYKIHKYYFETIINENSNFKSLLLGIKTEYEECINTILRGQMELVYLSRKLAEQVTAPSTIRNLKERSKYLEEKIRHFQEDDIRMFDRIDFLQSNLLGRAAADNMEYEDIPETPGSWPRPQPLPDLTMTEQTHIPTLKKKLALINTKLTKAREAYQKKFCSKEIKVELVERLIEKENLRDELETKAKSLHLRLGSVKASFGSMLRRSSKREDVLGKIDYVFQIAKDHLEGKSSEEEEDDEEKEEDEREEPEKEIVKEESEEDDPAISTQERLLIDCVTNFNMSIIDGEIDEAVLFAAHSPQGVLRTRETLKTLKDLGSDSLFMYWEALLSSLHIQHSKLSTWETIEYVKYSLEKDKILELTYWLAQNVLEDVEEIADMITTHCVCLDKSCQCSLWGLAQPIFTRIGNHKKATVCFLQQGRISGALEYARDCGHLNKKELMDAFRLCKSSVVALKLSRRQIPFKPVFTIEETLSILMKSQEDNHLACDLIKKAVKDGYKIRSSAIDKPGVSDNSREINDKWMDLCRFCLNIGLVRLAEELFAYLIVKMAMAHAKKIHIITRYIRFKDS